MLKKIINTIQGFSLLDKSDRVAVAVSGGPDSVCLLLVLNSLKEQLGITLFVAHLNHKLRQKESDEDECYVKGLAEKFSLPLLTESVDTKSFAKEKNSWIFINYYSENLRKNHRKVYLEFYV